MSDFIEFSVVPKAPAEEHADIVIALLSSLPFDTFEYENETVKAYASATAGITESEAIALIEDFSTGNYTWKIIPKENWNELWEKNFFEPVTVGGRFYIRAAFHPAGNAEHEIIIQPRMSFGTGHHFTTQLMLELMLQFENEIRDTNVLDMGAGTGVLAIAAEKLGAAETDAVEIEAWSAENVSENAVANGCKKITSYHDDASFLEKHPEKKYQVVLANIHREVLINDVPVYVKSMLPGGLLFLSGFFPEDLSNISQAAENSGLHYLNSKTAGNWCAAVYRK